ncbi:MAG: adenylate/guanylate cyclase domain-containing protein [Treponema sp.]|nr:adenylate/guanylate cyclase domain-containing protein [Treponema sp.]
MAKKAKIGKKLTALIIICLVFLVITGLRLLGVFTFLENKSYDMRVRFWANSSFSIPSHDIVLILIEQDCLDWALQERGWGWPWPRQAYAEIVDFMNLSKVKSVAFDVLFSEPSIYRNARQDEIIDTAIMELENAENTIVPAEGRRGAARQTFRIAVDALQSLKEREDDASFINAAANFGNVVQAVVFSTQSGNIFSWPGDLESPLFLLENFDGIMEKFSVGENERGQFPIHGLRESAGALGSVTGIPDSDGIIRRLKLFTLFDNKAIPGLSAATLLVDGKNNNLYFNSKNSTIEWEDISIPVDKDGYALLRYRGELGRYIPYLASAILKSSEMLKNNEEPLLSPSNFEGTHVFFGFNAQGLFDIFSTPISAIYPGVGCHVTMLDNMLQGDFIRESSELVNILILLAVVIVIVCITIFLHRIALSVSGMVVIVAAIIIGAFASYQFGGLWVPMITYLAGTLAAFVTATLYNYATEGSQKRFIKSAFSQYLSPKVIEQIIHDPSQLKLGGENRQMSAIFTDVRAFSTFSEALGDPAKLVELLNFYLTRMSNIILDNQGTIDKYVGDAIVSFFGAPIHMKNHAALACRSAVMMKKAELEINREALEKGLVNQKVLEALFAKGKIKGMDDPCPVFTRLGINSGDMVVGNMGTPNKMDYTIMGNAVNLAARLEGVNDQYNTGGILISEYTKTQLSENGSGNEFVMRPLSRVRVVGINTPLRLYELLDITKEAPPELLEMVKNWEQAFDLYEKKDFPAARNIFQGIFGKNGNDLVAKKYIDRCAKFISSPPDEKAWDSGVDNLTSK